MAPPSPVLAMTPSRAGTACCLLFLGLCALGRADPATPRPVIGVMTHFAQGWDPSLADVAADAGIRDVRDEIYWQDVEPQAGRFVFPERYERYMAALRRRGISPLVELTFANRAYDGGMTPFTPRGFDAYARYGVEVLRHYGDQIGAVEIWNEYNGTFCKGPAADDRPATYARMAAVAYRALKAERPGIVVAGGATAGVPLPYFERLFAAGGLDSMDAVSIHPYRYDGEPEGLEDQVAALRDLIKRHNHGVAKPIWVTEIGWGTKPAASPGDLAIDEGVQASFVVRAYALLLSAGVERIYWYLFRDYDAFATMGLVRDDRTHTPKEAYHAMETLIREIGDARFVRREDTPRDLYSLLFERASGEQVRVLWSLRPYQIAVPAACRVVGMLGDPRQDAILGTGGKPVFVDGPLTGLPAGVRNPPKILADSARGFSDTQGADGWSYGSFVGDSTAFTALADFRSTDWKREWYGPYAFLSLTDTEQHPAESPAGAVAAVRRWTSARGGRVRIVARFHCGPKGDGVGVKVLLDGRERFSESVGGPNQAAVRYDAVEQLAAGVPLDFAVYPGPKGNSNFDATEVSVTIEEDSR
jgi:Glycosyl hydrolase catalytic core